MRHFSSRSAIKVFSWAIVVACAVAAPVAAQNQSAADLTKLEVRGSEDFQQAIKAFFNREAPKIVGGEVAPAGAYPWQVSLVVSWIADPYNAHFCGGSIYNARWIVTAAHCVINNQPQDLHVISGVNKLAKNVVRTNVRRIVMHKSYASKTYDNDVALLELFDEIPLNERSAPIALLSPQEEEEALSTSRKLTVTGWGRTSEGGSTVKDLRFVDIPPVSRATCNQPPSYDGRITENMICAGRALGGQDSCQGDSGGPLVTDKSQGPQKLAGIVSWGEGCAKTAKYGVYTRVARYNDWIKQCVANPDACR